MSVPINIEQQVYDISSKLHNTLNETYTATQLLITEKHIHL